MKKCASREIWRMLDSKISDILESFTLERLVQIETEKV
jgi:DNA-binding IscR family transcriptional regulator